MGDGRWACQPTLDLFFGVPIQLLFPVSLDVLLFIVAPFVLPDFLVLSCSLLGCLFFALKQACDSSPRARDISRNPNILDTRNFV